MPRHDGDYRDSCHRVCPSPGLPHRRCIRESSTSGVRLTAALANGVVFLVDLRSLSLVRPDNADDGQRRNDQRGSANHQLQRHEPQKSLAAKYRKSGHCPQPDRGADANRERVVVFHSEVRRQDPS